MDQKKHMQPTPRQQDRCSSSSSDAGACACMWSCWWSNETTASFGRRCRLRRSSFERYLFLLQALFALAFALCLAFRYTPPVPSHINRIVRCTALVAPYLFVLPLLPLLVALSLLWLFAPPLLVLQSPPPKREAKQLKPKKVKNRIEKRTGEKR